MQRVEMEEARTREANATALQAIGPRKKPKLDIGGSATNSLGGNGGFTASSGLGRQMPLRPRLKRVNFRDLLFLLEQEKETCRSTTLYKSYLKWLKTSVLFVVLLSSAELLDERLCTIDRRCKASLINVYIDWTIVWTLEECSV